MKDIIHKLLTYVVTDRRLPHKNRERVGQNLMLLAIFIFFIFMINFAVIIGTDKKFGVKLSERAEEVYKTSKVIQARRGTIYDRNGIPIAEDSTTYSVFAIIDKNYISAEKKPLYVQNKQFQQVADIFHEALGIEKDYVLSQLGQEDLSQVSFGVKGGNISYSVMKSMKETLEKAGITGVDFLSSPDRMYPNGAFASHFIGLAQPQENKDGSKSLVGTTGLEATLDDLLSGQDGLVTYQKDRNGVTQLGTAEVEQEAQDGQDVYTTLSAPIQINLETQLDYFQSQTKGKFASATLVHAKTGDILATSQRPSFNSDTKNGLGEDDFSWQNLLYQNNYEPGSTFKVLTTAIAIDAGVFNPNEVYFNDQLQIADAVIRDWDVNAELSSGRYMSMADALPHSSNIGMSMLQQRIGDDKWLNYLDKFRLGFPTRFGMSDEAAGLLPADNIVTYAMSAFGQGISVTQTQLLRSFLAIANDGVMLQPQFIDHLSDPSTGTTRWSQPEIMGSTVSAEAASQTRNYMVAVGTDPNFGTMYSNNLGGPIVQVGDESVAVKSGTAELAAPVEEGGGYLTGPQDYLYSVVAMVPAQDPEFIMYATVQQPTGDWNGLLWADLFNPILEEAMLIRDSIEQPVSDSASTPYKLPDISGRAPGDTADELRRHLLHPIILGTGNKITKHSVEVGTEMGPNSQVLLLTNKFERLPDLYGWTAENVQTLADWLGIEVTIQGEGRVVQQSRPLGTDLSGLKSLTVTLGDP